VNPLPDDNGVARLVDVSCMSAHVLGVNWWYHDAASAVVEPGGVVRWMAEEERFTRHRHAWGEFPVLSTAAGLRQLGVHADDISVVAVGWQPWLVEQAEGRPWPYSDNTSPLLARDLLGWSAFPPRCTVEFFDHHDAHAASAFYASPFQEAAVLVVDGHGERSSVTIYRADRTRGLNRIERYPRPFSLGYYYEAVTRHLGFRLLESGKTMGLASYETTPVEPLYEFLDGPPPGMAGVREDCTWDEGAQSWAQWIASTQGAITTRPADLPGDQKAVRLAAAAQVTIERALDVLVARARVLTGLAQVCLGGGVAQNCVAAGLIDEPVYVPPFSHDAGVALGAAWLVTGAAPYPDGVSPFLGDATEPLAAEALPGWCRSACDPDQVAELVQRGLVGGLYTGRAEVGARALGHRSLIASPGSVAIRDRINRMKGREPWRPLAPSGLPSCDGRYWEPQGLRAAYMAGSAAMTDLGRDSLPGACHVDGTCRMQTVRPGHLLHDVLTALQRRGSPPVVINTSFNDRGEPIVRGAADVVAAATRMDLDFLVWQDELLIRERGQ
jgi:carbamoyltransferase